MLLKLIFSLLVLAAALYGLSYLARKRRQNIEQRLPATGKFVQVKQHRIHYQEFAQGQGPSLLLIHGLGGSTGDLSYKLAPVLAQQFHVIVLDRLGAGYSSPTNEHFADINYQADLAADFLTALGIKRAYIAGHSLGGAISLNFAVHHSDMTEALLLIAPLSMPPNRLPMPFTPLYFMRPEAVRAFAAKYLVTPYIWLTEKTALKRIFSPEQPPLNFEIDGAILLGTRPDSIYGAACDIAGCQTGVTPEMVVRYKEINCPCSLIFGTDDKVLDHHKHGLALQYYLPQLEISLLSGKGHMITVTATEQILNVAEQLKHRTESTRDN